jgi:hypothetical protein
MGHSLASNGILQGLDNWLLPHNLFESLGPPLSG